MIIVFIDGLIQFRFTIDRGDALDSDTRGTYNVVNMLIINTIYS